MARLARKQLADMRALEEEAERMNPINPVHNSYREGYTGIVKGSGATPSMGLSQVRGGRKHHAKMSDDENAKSQGKALMEHLHNLHGSGYARDFHAGMAMCGGLGTGRYEGEGTGAGMEGCGTGAGMEEMKGGFWGALASLAAPLIGSLFGKGQMTKEAHDILMKKLANAKSKRKAKLEGGFWGALASLAVPLIGKLFGKGEMTKEAHDELMSKLCKKQMLGKDGHGVRKMKGAGRMVGAGNLDIEIKHGDMEGEGTGAGTGAGKMKRVVGAGDGRRKRAEIVKKVMREKNMSMIEASKYVKEHKLY
jgi:hypothetical protein